MKSFYYFTEPIFQCYDTDEEVEMVDDVKDPVGLPSKIIFQANYNPEHGYLCECEECGTKFFKSYEEADAYAEKWWEENMKDVKIQ